MRHKKIVHIIKCLILKSNDRKNVTGRLLTFDKTMYTRHLPWSVSLKTQLDIRWLSDLSQNFMQSSMMQAKSYDCPNETSYEGILTIYIFERFLKQIIQYNTYFLSSNGILIYHLKQTYSNWQKNINEIHTETVHLASKCSEGNMKFLYFFSKYTRISHKRPPLNKICAE